MKKISKLLVFIVTVIVFNFSAASCGIHRVLPPRVAVPVPSVPAPVRVAKPRVVRPYVPRVRALRVARPYYYYPNSRVYYSPKTRNYFYLSGGRWLSAPRLPKGVRLNKGGRVLMKLKTTAPYTNFVKHKLAHPSLIKGLPGVTRKLLKKPRLILP